MKSYQNLGFYDIYHNTQVALSNIFKVYEIECIYTCNISRLICNF